MLASSFSVNPLNTIVCVIVLDLSWLCWDLACLLALDQGPLFCVLASLTLVYVSGIWFIRFFYYPEYIRSILKTVLLFMSSITIRLLLLGVEAYSK